jgi:prevent-host-death family protein
MKTVNIHQAKTQLSRLLKRVESGEEVILARAGKPVAKLVPMPAKKRREPGLWLKKYPHLLPELEKLGELIEQPLPEDELALWEQ